MARKPLAEGIRSLSRFRQEAFLNYRWPFLFGLLLAAGCATLPASPVSQEPTATATVPSVAPSSSPFSQVMVTMAPGFNGVVFGQFEDYDYALDPSPLPSPQPRPTPLPLHVGARVGFV